MSISFRATGLAFSLAAALAIGQASAQEWHTTSSLMGASKYGENFQRYDYVNPDAPKGGTLNSVAGGTFDSFNPFIVRGTSPANLPSLLYDTLMEDAYDEQGVGHALVAEAYKFPDDYSSATYRLNPAARWHDGQSITVDDVIWSFNALKANDPMYNRYYENVTEAVAAGDREVEFRFDQKGNRELPKIVGQLPILPKHWWEGNDANGKRRDITQPTLEPPLGSAAYKIASFKPGQEIVWERVPDYWGAKLPVKIGRENFDKRRYIYIQDDNAAWQAFTKGGFHDIKDENVSRRWATFYNFPAFQAGDVIKKEFEATARANFQGFMLNTRRPQFQDRRVRQALTIAFDFETLNRTVFFGSYSRTNSFFIGGELASGGLPQGRELEILNEFKDKLPPEMFTQVYTLPVYEQPKPGPNDRPAAEPASTPKPVRTHLRDAVKLFAEAGWTIKDNKLVNEKGEQFTLEILGNDSTDEIIGNPYVNSLRQIGINATLRIIDPNQYVNRLRDFDFDVTSLVVPQSESPGNEQRDFWSSKAADTPGSRNYSGIKNPVVDALIDKVIFAKDRDELVAATHALDRVLLWEFYAVPQYNKAVQWLAYWNKFGIPEKQPDVYGADIDSWWIDPEKEAALAAKYKGAN